MVPEPAASVAEALESGEPDRVNRVIDLVDGMSVEERAGVFDTYYDVAQTAFEADEGYVRQSAIRFAEALHPGLALRAVGRLDTAEPVPGEFTLADAARHRRRLRDFFLRGLVDDDGRVRRAAIKGMKTVAVAADVIDEQEELETLLGELESLLAEADDPAEAHIEEAVDQVSFYLAGSPVLIPQEVLEQLSQD